MPAELVKRITKSVEGIGTASVAEPRAWSILCVPKATASVEVLRDRARLLEQQAAELRELATAVHEKRVQMELVKTLAAKEDDIDLLTAALLIAKLDNEDLDIAAYRKEIERMVRELTASLPRDADEAGKLAALNKYLFTERGFHGSRTDYYNRANSYLNEVIDDREGLPITLSVLYMELARRVGVKVVGIGLPGHFIVQHVPATGKRQLIDVYDGGRPLSREEAGQIVRTFTGEELRKEDLRPVSKKAILLRMLHNLLGLTPSDDDIKGAFALPGYDSGNRAGSSQGATAARDGTIADGRSSGAREDVEWLVQHEPAGIDREQVLELRRLLTQPDR